MSGCREAVAARSAFSVAGLNLSDSSFKIVYLLSLVDQDECLVFL